MQNQENNIWYLELPAYRYNENVQELAKAAGLRIIDANVTSDRTGAAPDEDLPVVTLREEFTPEYLAAQAQFVTVEKMEAAIIEKIREQFRAMPYEQQLSAYHASQGTTALAPVEQDEQQPSAEPDAPESAPEPAPPADPEPEPAAAPAKSAAPASRKKKDAAPAEAEKGE